MIILLLFLLLVVAVMQLVVGFLILDALTQQAAAQEAESVRASQAVRRVHRQTVHAMFRTARGESPYKDYRP